MLTNIKLIPTAFYPINISYTPQFFTTDSPFQKINNNHSSSTFVDKNKLFLKKKTGRKYKNLVECYKCDFEDCSILFEKEEDLNKHKLLHKNVIFCPFFGCGMKFENEKNLQKHQKIHIPSKKIYQCSYPGCTKSFTASYNLKIHYRIHTGERPYQCNICGMKYYDRANYKYHCKTAHVEKNNKDTICSHINCQHTFKTKKQKIMHHDKLEEECRSEKNFLMNLLSDFQKSMNILINDYYNENEINSLFKNINLQKMKIENFIMDKNQYDAIIGNKKNSN